MGFLQKPKPLESLPRFGDLSDAEMRQVCEAGREVNVPEGWSLVWEHTPADKAYLVLEGKAGVRHGGETIAELGPGDIVGEVALRERRLRTATVFALTPLTLLHFTSEAFQQLYETISGFRAAVDRAVAERTGAYQASEGA
jgi:CRP-like cAMP-binding protein